MALPTDPASAGVMVLQGAILLVLIVAVRRGNTAAVVNALLAFTVTLFPLALEVGARVLLERTVAVGPELPLWIAAAGCLHAYGMLGPYDSVRWWDLLTHAVSAALVTALAYAALLVATGPRSAAAAAVAFTLVVGVFWELVELVAREVGDRYDVEPVLVNYGWRDTASDLLVDVAAGLAVVLVDVRVFVPLAEQFPGSSRALVVGGGVVVLAGSAAMALVVGLAGR